MNENIYMVVGRGRYGYPQIRRWKKKSPALAADEVAFKLVVNFPNNILQPQELDVTVKQENIIRPKPTVTTE